MGKLHTYWEPVMMSKDGGDQCAWTFGNYHGLGKPVLQQLDEVFIINLVRYNGQWSMDCLASGCQHGHVVMHFVISNICLLPVQQCKSGELSTFFQFRWHCDLL